jgi:uncharacterized protein
VENDSAPIDALPADLPEPGEADAQDVVDALPADAPLPGAVPDVERIAALDVLRGFALLGILVMNIQSFAMIDAAYANPTAYGNLEGANYLVWLLSHLLADQKFMTIFSMLFGAGILLMSGRREKAGGRSAAIHYRRMGALAVFGLLHAYLLWFGDILFSYALCGMIVYLLRKLRPWALLLLGSFAVAVPSALFLLLGAFLLWVVPEMPPDVQADIEPWTKETSQGWQPSARRVDAELAAYRGGWVQELRERWPAALALQTILFGMYTFWRAGGLMLIGMALFQLGVFSASLPDKIYLAFVAAALLLGIPIIAYGVHANFAAEWDVEYAEFVGSQFNYWGSIVVSLGWVGLVMLACKREVLRPLTRPFAAVGQMALTNYLLHTLICTTIFYGHGFGLYGQVERVGQIEIVLAIWLFQLVVSPWWLHYFRFGPAEWLWRSLTYWRLPPMWRGHGALEPAAIA